MSGLADTAGEAFNQLILDELAVERSLKDSLAQRGITVVTTSGTLVTLVFAFTALTTASKASPFRALAPWIRGLFVAGLAGFIVAVALGIAISLPRKYNEVDEGGFATMLDPRYWSAADPVEGARAAATARTEIIATFRRDNATNARLLRYAILAEFAAVSLLAGAAAGIVLPG